MEKFAPDALFALGGRRALVTGGSLGIGRAIALALASAGADVAIQYDPAADAAADRPDAAASVVNTIRRSGRRATAISADFARDEAARCAAQANAEMSGLDILVLCAAIQERLPFAAVNAGTIERHVAVNFAAPIALLQATLPAMTGNGWGRVLAIGSSNAQRPDPELAIYAALKAAQHNIIMGLARAHGTHGVTLNTISPGLIATDRNAARRTDAVSWADTCAAANPMGRAGDPLDIAGAALLLCSPAGAFITGADLPVSGGAQL